jgi:hypothetical protein
MRIEISKKHTFDVGADRVWAILGDDFDKVGQWARGVDRSAPNRGTVAPEGARVGGRVCQTPGFGAIEETFTSFDASHCSYAFQASASNMPSFVRNLTNHTTVRGLSPNHCEVELKITAGAAGIRGVLAKPVITRKFSQAIDELFEDLRVFAETGDVSAEKTKAMAKASH